MGKINDYATGTAALIDKVLVSDGTTGETKNILVSSIVPDLTTYLETTITSAEILAIQGTPKTILAAPGANKYYKYHAILEYTYGTIAYSSGGGSSLYLEQGSKDCYFPNNFLTFTGNNAAVGTFYGYAKMNTALKLTTDTNSTLGDGTCKLKLWYTIKTFG